MASQKLCLKVIGLAVLLTLTALRDVSSDSNLLKILRKRDVAETSNAPSKSSVAIPSSKAQEFLAKLSRNRRNVWDRSRPDVQQWIMQFMQMGFDEQRLEADLQYWMDHARSNDQGRQHHYDENSPMGPRDTASYRHGANVNYDYY
ncbi:augurin-A isoform X1 [Nothobranchius furzeri]|uniref:Chromosome 2 open reading frame 40 n=1 Tax=Nothobranchius furzeri TaxID=105023 RepID=A0A1A8APA2_NOTFU|nr:augurin-A isoform X1 [Nothobranchius furzeri]KAF7215577.1 transcript variant X1 [Nothobranchius furzeri]